jgi:DNA modification methylase
MPDNYLHAIVTDPPYGLSFMGKAWDYDVPKVEIWREALRVLKPGGHLLAFAGSRTYHRMAVAIEDAGFEIRDQLIWMYGSGFPKSLNIGKAVDKIAEKNTELIERKFAFGRHIKEERLKAGITLKQLNETFGYVAGCNWWEAQKESNNRLITWNDWVKLKEIITTLDDKFVDLIEDRPQKWIEREREVIGKTIRGNAGFSNEQVPRPWKETIGEEMPITKGTSEWEGYGTALKPAHEPCVLARKPIEGTVANNVLKHGTGGLNIDGTRVAGDMGADRALGKPRIDTDKYGKANPTLNPQSPLGRFPANLIHDGSDEVEAVFPDTGKSGVAVRRNGNKSKGIFPVSIAEGSVDVGFNDSGSASRYFYTAKASKRERGQGNNHPTVKPIALMKYLVKLVAPPKNGIIYDPFSGSGTTLLACQKLGIDFIGSELSKEYCDIAEKRLGQEVLL